jgi:hypothetical protein
VGTDYGNRYVGIIIIFHKENHILTWFVDWIGIIVLVQLLLVLRGKQSRCSIVVSIPACHAGDPGSIPGNGDIFLLFFKRSLLGD